jgi:hypothetical protein
VGVVVLGQDGKDRVELDAAELHFRSPASDADVVRRADLRADAIVEVSREARVCG